MSDWYAVRHIVKNGCAFEERVTLWFAASFDEAMDRARAEAEQYVSLDDGWELLELFQAYRTSDVPQNGAEVFSLIRESDLAASEYIDRFFATGGEFQIET
jgi:hypothetical protein